MVIIYGGVAVRPEALDEVAAAAVDFQSQCNAEEGCVEYTLSWRVGAPEQLRLVEVWEDVEAYERHTGQSHVERWTEFISERAAGAPKFTRNDVPE